MVWTQVLLPRGFTSNGRSYRLRCSFAEICGGRSCPKKIEKLMFTRLMCILKRNVWMQVLPEKVLRVDTYMNLCAVSQSNVCPKDVLQSMCIQILYPVSHSNVCVDAGVQAKPKGYPNNPVFTLPSTNPLPRTPQMIYEPRRVSTKPKDLHGALRTPIHILHHTSYCIPRSFCLERDVAEVGQFP